MALTNAEIRQDMNALMARAHAHDRLSSSVPLRKVSGNATSGGSTAVGPGSSDTNTTKIPYRPPSTSSTSNNTTGSSTTDQPLSDNQLLADLAGGLIGGSGSTAVDPYSEVPLVQDTSTPTTAPAAPGVGRGVLVIGLLIGAVVAFVWVWHRRKSVLKDVKDLK